MCWVYGLVVFIIEVIELGMYMVFGIGNNGCISFVEVLVEFVQGECNVLFGCVFVLDDCVVMGIFLVNWLIEIIGDDFLEYCQINFDGEYEIYLLQGNFNV